MTLRGVSLACGRGVHENCSGKVKTGQGWIPCGCGCHAVMETEHNAEEVMQSRWVGAKTRAPRVKASRPEAEIRQIIRRRLRSE